MDDHSSGSASVDGTIKTWEDRKSSPIAVLRPHNGLPVNSVTFLTAPHRPDHIILITGGPLNREVKIWASESEEGWLLPSDADSWHCTQTLELKSSTEPTIENAFFNQVVALSQSGLLLLANAKKNAIYAVHLDYGPNPEMSCMDYIAEFTVTMPILSFTGTSDLLPNGDHIVQVYCVQTQAIQQYALDLSQCLPPPVYDVYEKSGSTVSRDATSIEGFAGLEPASGKLEPASTDGALVSSQPLSSPLTEAETKSISPPVANGTDISCVASPTVPLSPKLSGSISDLLSPSSGFKPRLQLIGYADQKMDYPVDRQLETAHSNLSNVSLLDDDENRVTIERFKHPIHLVTPAELMATSSAEVNDVPVKSDTRSAEVETKVVGETGISQNADTLLQVELNGSAYDEKGKSKCFSSQASGLGLDMARDMVNESRELDGIVESKVLDQTTVARNEVDDVATDQSGHVETAVGGVFQSVGSSFREKKKKKNAQISGPSFLNVLESADSSAELGVSSSVSSAEAILLQIQSLQETIAQVLINQKEIQKQIPMLAAVMPALVPVLGHAVTPVIEKAVSTAVSDTFQAGIGDKAVNQLENAVDSKVEATVSRQIQVQFQTSGKQALQEALRSIMETSVVPALETFCKTMFDQIDATFQKRIAALVPDVVYAVTPFIEKAVSTAVSETFKDTINSASLMTQTLIGELTDGQKLMALNVAGENSRSSNTLMSQISDRPITEFHEKIEAPADLTEDVSNLLDDHKYVEAFTAALQKSDVRIVSWLCSQVDLQQILTRFPLSQGVLLSLLQQLACDIVNHTSRKLSWMMDVVVAIKPSDEVIADYVRPIFDQVYSLLNHQASLPTTSAAELSNIRILMRLINSMPRSS